MRRTSSSRSLVAVAAAFAAAAALALPAATAAGATPKPSSGHHHGKLAALHSLRGPVTDENFYFVMGDRFANGSTANDTGGLGADPLVSGFDPTKKGFYQGGDLKGLRSKLAYIRGLGATSIWLTPVFKNKAVQLEDGPSAGYHGYWITDFTQVDPHLGTNQDLADLISAAHRRGMKVFFDIITNHTADVIGYQQGARQPYVSKDVAPYKTASGTVFDDRDYAGTNHFPVLDPSGSFPYTPVLDDAEKNLKAPAWLNDVTLYHNRGDTTFTGEDSQYGDFFGLDDLFTENPKVVTGMTDIYQTWIKNFGVDGFRVDTMKHVNDEFWQKFAPAIVDYAHHHGKPEFFVFGEVALDGHDAAAKAFTSHYTTTDKVQAILDFPFQSAARGFASGSGPASDLSTFFANDDWYTDADSNAYELPTFLGNHDMGRIGFFLKTDNPGATDDELLQRDRLAHELLYFSRGNPIVYYGDEQGFAGNGGDQAARQTMFASQVPDYLADDLIGTSSTHALDNYNASHPLYQDIKALAALTKAHPALRNGTHQNRYASDGPGIYAFSRVDRHENREYVVALNDTDTAQTASIPVYAANGSFTRLYGTGAGSAVSGPASTLSLTVAPLSTVVYESDRQIPRSHGAPHISLEPPMPSEQSRDRIHVAADVAGSSYYDVAFYAKAGPGRWHPIGTDDTAPYQVFHDVSGLATGTGLSYRAVVLDNAGHAMVSRPRAAVVPEPIVTIEAPAEASKVRGAFPVRAVVDPERGTHVVRIQRSVAGGSWTTIGTDSSSPAYTAFEDLTPLALVAGTEISYRAILTEPSGRTAISAIRQVTAAGPPVRTATLRYFRPAGDYGDPASAGWGLHLFGDAVAQPVLAQVAWDKPWPRARLEDGWAVYDIPLKDDTKPVSFIMHLPSGDSVPSTREPGGDRSFTPLDSPEVWIRQGDPTVYTSAP
jgi:alpha-amylase